MRRQQSIAYFSKKPETFIIVATAVIGFAVIVTTSLFSGNGPGITDGVGGLVTLSIVTILFILLPCWIVAFFVKHAGARAGIAYERIRSWFWAPAACLSVFLAVFVGFSGEQLQIDTAKGNGDDMGGLIFFFFYMWAAILAPAIGAVLALYRIAALKRLQKTNG